MNGGQCVDMGTENNPKQFTCACAEGYTGLTCQKRIDPCADEPCQNGGICEPRGEHFHCSCSERFRGKLCEQYIRKRNPCLGDPCGAHGYCEVVNYDFICQCSPGYHGSRCEFEEEPAIVEEEEEEPIIVPLEEEEADSRKALVIGEVVLAFFIVFVVILILLCIHWMRVANRRSKHQAIQEIRIAAGKETEATPGWFEASNTLCYDFFCYCCKLVSKYENDCCCTEKVEVAEKRPSRAPSVASSKPPSRPPSKASSKNPSIQPSPEPVIPDEVEVNPNNVSNCWLAGDPMDLSQNRATLPYYNVARHYPVMPARYRSRGGNENSAGDDMRASSGDRLKMARGSFPGFQPGLQYLQGESEQLENEAASPAPRKMRVRRYLAPRGRLNKAVVDISDCDDYEDEEEEFDKLEDDDSAMVGPSGNVVPMPFRGRMVMSNDAGNVDQLYFDESSCYNQSNSFGRPGQEGTVSDGRGNVNSVRGGDFRGRRASYRDSNILNHHNGSRNNAADSESDDCSDRLLDSGDDDGEYDNDNSVPNGNDTDSFDDEGDSDVDEGPYYPPAPRPSNRRRPRRYHRRRNDAGNDDGYSSTGRMSESDAGGRSRDPLSVEAVTRQAQRNFYSRQSRNSTKLHAQSPVVSHPQNRISRQELMDKNSRRRQESPGITLSPHPSAPPTAPATFNSRLSPFQQPMVSPNSPSPFTVASTENHRSTPSISQQHCEDQLYPNHYYRQNQETGGISVKGRAVGGSSSRRPRSSFQGWDRSSGGLPTGPAPGPYIPQTGPRMNQEQQPAQIVPPSRRKKVKGILKKTSAYDTLGSGRLSSRSSGGRLDRRSSIQDNAYSYTPTRQMRFPPGYPPPPAYDQFVFT
ncbi:hypothetical protein PoB_007092800 [Plakobranchus ocellatus]|uniref:EGF-like domain-containing protein n=1 Tax=Plakobranchus ocellatus TaxID=259542 RepID=A0AAV4DK24_9GAST|nr:hypothetical protein PoB_007092800 [Plakobranchus ocellatus]